MAERAPSVRQQDVERATKALRKAGLLVERVEIEPSGKVVIVTSGEAVTLSEANEWDEEP